MARDADIERLLRDWAQWRTVGDGSGYPRTSMLHPEWMPPAKGQTPCIKLGAPSRCREVDRALRGLSERLQETVTLYYCTQLPLADQAARLGCQVEAIHQRIRRAHRLLLGLLDHANPAPPEKCQAG